MKHTKGKKGGAGARIAAACVLPGMLLALSGCSLFGGKSGGDESSSVSYPQLSFSVPASAPAAGSSPAAPSSSEAAAYVGVYEVMDGYDNPEYRPRFVLREDGSFAGVANLLEAMGFCEGDYTVADNQVYVTVTSADFFTPGAEDPHNMGWFMGAEQGTLEIRDSDHIVLSSPDRFLGDTAPGTVFTRSSAQDVAPVEFSAQRPPVDDLGMVGQIEAEGGLNMRSGPGQSYGKLLLIPDGETVAVLEVAYDDNDKPWVRVEYNSQEGWVSGEYIHMS